MEGLKEVNFSYLGEDLESMKHANNYHNWVIDKFYNFVGDVILEVGAGMGTFTHHLSERFPNSTIIALEPSNEMFPFLERYSSINKKVIPIKDFSFNLLGTLQKFNVDTVIYNNVLEHIENDLDELNNAYKILQNDGHILTYSPAMSNLHSDFDDSIGHFRRYHKLDLESKFKQSNFSLCESHYCDVLGSFLWMVKYKLLKQKSLDSKNVKLYDQAVVPLMKRFEPKTGTPFGKNLLMIGRKKV